MSANDRPEVRAFRELETLVKSLGEELASFRRRALSAESELKNGSRSQTQKSAAKASSGAKGSDVESEHETLRNRLSRAEDRVRQMSDRVRFLRQQLQAQPASAGRS